MNLKILKDTKFFIPYVLLNKLKFRYIVFNHIHMCSFIFLLSLFQHHSYRTFQGITCLMQVSTATEDFLIDTLALRNDLSPLNEIFTNPAIVKVKTYRDQNMYCTEINIYSLVVL